MEKVKDDDVNFVIRWEMNDLRLSELNGNSFLAIESIEFFYKQIELSIQNDFKIQTCLTIF